jgi:hypothetical protein
LARIDASSEAAKYALSAAGDAAKANANAPQAAREAADSNAKALNASQGAEQTKAHLLAVKDQVSQILSGQYESFSKSLFATEGLREALGKVGDQQYKDLAAQIDAISNGLPHPL